MLPTISEYSSFLDRAMNKFNISRDEARNKYGKYTEEQWRELLKIEVKNPTDMYHIVITLEDTFSFATVKKHTTVSGLTLSKMQDQIGQIVIDRFNKSQGIHETFKLKSIERS